MDIDIPEESLIRNGKAEGGTALLTVSSGRFQQSSRGGHLRLSDEHGSLACAPGPGELRSLAMCATERS